MATVKAVLNKRYKSKDGTYPVVIRIIDGTRQTLHNTGHKVKDNQFKNGEATRHPDAAVINSDINDLLTPAKRYIADCRKDHRQINFEEIFKKKSAGNFIELLEERSRFYKDRKQQDASNRMTLYVNELKEIGVKYIDDINIKTLEAYDIYLINKGNKQNTRKKKFKNLGRFAPVFKQYKINSAPVKKDKLTTAEITAIENATLSGLVDDARNLFLLSYYCKGMRFENCVLLDPEKQIMNGRIFYTTNKGKKHLSVLLHERLKNILSKLNLPYCAYDKISSVNVVVNRNLKIVAGIAGIKTNLSMHIARHTFAYHLKQKLKSVSVIQDSLGHSRSSTTEVYLKSLDDEILDVEMHDLYGD
jgi:integrase/recombinase XerD